MSLPTSMDAVRLHPDGPRFEHVAVPTPEAGQVLVRMHASPINPNDLLFLDGDYEVVRPLPAVAGFEGSGTVVAAGPGLIGRFLVGRRVAVVAGDGGGTWAEYCAAPADSCVPLRGAVTLEQASMLLTNPLTAQVLFERASRGGTRPFVQNAAGGALGTMILRLALRRGVDVVHVVRRPAEVERLQALGAAHTLASQAPDFQAQLSELCARLGVEFALDCVAGAATGSLLAALVDGGTVLVYGKLSGQDSVVGADDLVFRDKQVTGFTMYRWVAETSKLDQLRMIWNAQASLDGDLKTAVRDRFPLQGIDDALAAARAGGAGKILLVADREAVS